MNILGSLPDGLKEYVKMLLSSTPTVRPDADQLSKVINRGCVCVWWGGVGQIGCSLNICNEVIDYIKVLLSSPPTARPEF